AREDLSVQPLNQQSTRDLTLRRELHQLELRTPIVENSSFHGTYTQAGPARKAKFIVYPSKFGALGICLSICPLNALHRTDRNAVSDSFTDVGHDCICHVASHENHLLSGFRSLWSCGIKHIQQPIPLSIFFTLICV